MAAAQINNREFQEMMKEDRFLLVDYWAPWCGYCRRIGPAYDKLAQELGDKLTIAKINIDEEALLAQQENIEVIPTLVLYRKGQAVDSIVAPESKARIEAFLRDNGAL